MLKRDFFGKNKNNSNNKKLKKKPFFKFFFNIYMPVLAISFVLYINIVHKVWVDLLNERQQENHGLLGKKTNPME